MPEYSSTTITPADGVKTPAMNGSTSGNYTLSALRDFILASKGQANGLASLDANGKLPSSQLPDLADDVIVVASYASLPATGTAGKIYITADNNKMYRWNPDLATPDYVELSIDLSEYARIVDIQDGNIQAGVAVKAFQDAMGRAIITTYATKADLQDGTLEPLISTKARQDQNGNVIDQTYETKADASDLKSAIQGNSQRIENLEVAVSGSLVQTNILTDPPSMANVRTITNANEILPWAILKRVGARAIAWNQLAKPIEASKWVSSYGSGLSFSDGVGTQSITQSYQYSRCTIPLIAGHKYLIFGSVAHNGDIAVGLGAGASFYNQGVVTTKTGDTQGSFENFQTSGIWVASTETYFIIMAMSSSVTQIKFKECVCFDLTDMSMASLTANQFRSKFPASYYPYNAGEIIPLNPSAFKVVGKNKWDEQWELGAFNTNTGAKNPSGTAVTSKNYIPVEGGTSYYFNTGGANIYVFQYDASKNYLGSDTWFRVQDSNKVLASNCAYIQLEFPGSYGSVYKDDTMICLNSVTDKTYEAYSETTIDTSDVPVGYVDSSHYNYKENVLVNGVMRGAIHGDVIRTKVMKGTDGGWAYEHHDGYDLFYYNITMTEDCLPNYYKPTSGNEVPIMADGANAVSRNALTDVSGSTINVAIQPGVSPFLMFCAPSSMNLTSSALFNAWLADHNVTIRYRTREDTQTVTYTEPIPNIPCEDGTTVQAVTPQTDIVNAIDVPSTIAYMTKISS